MSRLGKEELLQDKSERGRKEIVRRHLRENFEANSTRGTSMVGSCLLTRELVAELGRVSATDLDLHLVGEAGSGKALAARAVHTMSSRDGAFVCVRLADLNEDEMEAALFGHTLPVGGTLFVDNIELLPASLVERLSLMLSATSSQRQRYRLVCGSNQELEDSSLLALFSASSQLATIKLPALRERGEDIPQLAVHFVSLAMQASGRVGLSIGRQAMAELCAYSWPGNVEELRRVIGDMVVRTADHSEIGSGIVFAGDSNPLVEQVVSDVLDRERGLDAAMAELEAAIIREALAQQKGNRSAAARQLKLPRQTLQDRMKKHGLWTS